MVAGNTYPVSVTVITNSTYHEYVTIWFDFNGNGDLEDDGDVVFDYDASFNGTQIYTGEITVPSDAYNGDIYIRMIMSYSSLPVLCGSYSYGTTIDMKANLSGGITPRNLQVSATGSVTSSPSGINTSEGWNSSNFADGTNVTLSAVSTSILIFSGWSGDIVSNDNPLTVTLDADKNITANFIDITNSAPLANDDGTYTVYCNSTVSGNVLDNDTDTDGDDLDVSNVPILAYGSFTSFDVETGAFSYKAPNDWAGTFTFDYSATDLCESSIAVATIEVTNRTPSLNADVWKIYPGESLPHNVLSNDSDPDGQTLSVSTWGALSSSNASLSASDSEGNFTFLVPVSVAYNFSENITFNYSAIDILSAGSISTVTMEVVTPTFNGVDNFSDVSSWNAERLPLESSDVVVEAGAIVSVSASYTVRNLTVKDGGKIIVTSGGVLSVTDNIYDQNISPLQIQINDGGILLLNGSFYKQGYERLSSGENTVRFNSTIKLMN